MSYQAACNRVIADAVRNGGKVFQGQFGQIVIQYPDRYSIGNGLSWCTNKGRYTPLPTFKGEKQDRDGEAKGETLWSEDGRGQCVWMGGKWHCWRAS